MSKFKRDLTKGKKAESLITTFFEEAGLSVIPNRAKAQKELVAWDLELTKADLCVRVEVKYDIMAAKTGNVAIEYYNHKKNEASGILATQAHYWIYVFGPSDYWIVSVPTLKKFLNEERGRMVSGGDDNSQMVLYAKNRVLGPVFKQLTKENICLVWKNGLEQ